MEKISKLIDEVENLKKEIKKSYLFRKRIYTIKETSIVIGVSISYVQKLISTNQIPYSKPNGKLIFIRRKDLEKFLMRNYTPTKDDADTILANNLLSLKKRL
ncbi:helix-turn-helix domain-containing protein [Tenacibaculum sp.]|uniref:helix-turn-helix domain-containing protein n=1 Tax=Tenacibaculum sp. TaxID=1906242 RepID=UPI003AA7FE90